MASGPDDGGAFYEHGATHGFCAPPPVLEDFEPRGASHDAAVEQYEWGAAETNKLDPSRPPRLSKGGMALLARGAVGLCSPPARLRTAKNWSTIQEL